MALHLLSLETIGELEAGKISKGFDKLLGEAVADCHSRAGDSSERIVTLQVRVKPVANEDCGGCDGTRVRFELKSKIPNRVTKSFDMGRKANNRLVFNDLATDNVRQRTLDQVGGSAHGPEDDGPEDDDDDLEEDLGGEG